MAEQLSTQETPLDAFRRSAGFQIMFVLHSGLEVGRAVDHLCASAEKFSAAQREWQPIDTAPKDERAILVFNDGEVVTVKWRYDDRWGGVWGSEDYIRDGSIYDDALIAHNPTHWMPLPPAPEMK